MSCLKCGRETGERQVFCGECLTEMEKYPVSSGVPVVLPRRKESPPVRRNPKRKTVSPEEQVKILRRRLRVTLALFLTAVMLAAALAVPAWRYVESRQRKPGQNYSVSPNATNSQTVEQN